MIRATRIKKHLIRNPYHAETSQLICIANQLTSLHINRVITHRVIELLQNTHENTYLVKPGTSKHGMSEKQIWNGKTQNTKFDTVKI